MHFACSNMYVFRFCLSKKKKKWLADSKILTHLFIFSTETKIKFLSKIALISFAAGATCDDLTYHHMQ